MTTMRDIANAAGVSLGTVSNYFNSPDVVASDTREAIRLAIKQLDFHPHAAARSLKTNQTRRLGLVPFITPEENISVDSGDQPFLEFLSGVNAGAAGLGYDLLLSAATTPARELAIYKRWVGERQVDGLVVLGIRPEDERIQLLLELNTPFVTFGRTNLDLEYAYVDVDGAAGMAEAVNFLAGQGHQRIAYILPPTTVACTAQRYEGFVRAMEANHLPVREEWVEAGGFSERSGQSAMHILLDLPQKPTAVLTANDLCAFGAIRALQNRGLQVGTDVSVVGFDNIGLSAHWHPPLTTIAQPFREIGLQCANSLVQLVTGKEGLPQKLIAPRLIERQSTGPNPER